MQAKRLVNQIIKRGGTAEIKARDGRHSRCSACQKFIIRHDVIACYEGGEDYVAWFLDPNYDKFIEGYTNGQRCEATGSDHEPIIDWEVVGELKGYDVHMFLSNSGQPQDGGNSCYTVRSISRRGEYDPSSDYNSGGFTFCNRLTDLDWAVR